MNECGVGRSDIQRMKTNLVWDSLHSIRLYSGYLVAKSLHKSTPAMLRNVEELISPTLVDSPDCLRWNLVYDAKYLFDLP